MVEMVERVAAKILDSNYIADPVEPTTVRHVLEAYFAEKDAQEGAKEVAVIIARAAIEAMREPSADVLEAMSNSFRGEPSRDDPMPHYLQRQRNALIAFIDAALK